MLFASSSPVLQTVALGALLFAASCKDDVKTKANVKAQDDVKAKIRECETECVTPFGTVLGSNRGIIAYSNCGPACINPTPASANTASKEDVYTGITWQCVEYARRWWLIERGAVFGSVDTADAMWKEVTRAQRPSDTSELGVGRHENGGTVAPAIGDLVIYQADSKTENLRFGHVAVVVGVDLVRGLVALAEQNFENKKWQAQDSHSRNLSLKSDDGHYTLTDKSLVLYGWLRLE